MNFTLPLHASSVLIHSKRTVARMILTFFVVPFLTFLIYMLHQNRKSCVVIIAQPIRDKNSKKSLNEKKKKKAVSGKNWLLKTKEKVSF